MTVKMGIETISPTKAEKWFGTIRKQRRLSETRVEHLADAIRRGEWVVTGQPISGCFRG